MTLSVTRRWLWIAPCVAMLGCGLLQKVEGVGKKNAVHVEPLIFQPDVKLAHELEISATQKLYVSLKDIFYQEGPQYYPVVVQGSPRIVGISDDKTSLAYIDPAEFEQVGNLYIFDFEKKSVRRLTNNAFDSQATVKGAKWRNNRLYYIQGYSLGTHSIGGSLYSIDQDGIQRRLLYDERAPEEGASMEVSEFEFAPHETLRLTLRSSSDKKRVVYIDSHGKILKR